jgi:hypothetical protein
MRTILVGLFIFGVAAFLVSVGFMGTGMGDTLWRAGVAAILVVLGMRAVWPSACAPKQ